MRFDRGGITFADTVITATNKVSFLESLHYTTTEEKISIINFTSFSAVSTLDIGGGVGGKNTATNIKFYTGTLNTTLSGVNRFEIQADGNIVINDTGVDADLSWKDSSNTVNFFLEGSTGFAGIGTTVLNIIGGAQSSSLTIGGADNGSSFLELGTDDNTDNAFIGGIFFANAGMSTNKSLASITASTDGGTSGNRGSDLRLNTKPDGGTSPVLRIFILEDGKVAIGNITPTEILDVAGNIKASGVIKINGTGVSYVLGNLGVGTTAPAISTGTAARVLTLGHATGFPAFELATNATDADNKIIGIINFTDEAISDADKRGVILIARTDGATANDRGGEFEIQTRANAGSAPVAHFKIDQAGLSTFNVSGVAGGDAQFLNSSSAVIAAFDANDDSLQFEDNMELQFGNAAGGDYSVFYDSTETALVFQPNDATNKQVIFMPGNVADQAFIWTSNFLDNSDKDMRVSSGHYDWITEEPVMVLNINNRENENHLAIGGNSGSHNAVTRGELHAAADNTTLTGSLILRWNIDRVEIFGNAFFKLENMSTTTRDGKTAENGDMIYNTTANVIQGFENGSWVNL